MKTLGTRIVLSCCLLLAAALSAEAQSRPLKGGYVARALATVTGNELSGQTDLWVLEVEFKLPRMVSVEVTDPVTKQKRQEWVWYLAYKATNRPIERREDKTDTNPTNDYDQPPRRPLFVPEFTLVTFRNKGDAPEILRDVVVPEAEPAIRAREKRELKNSVAVVREIPQPTPVGTPADDVIYGVAMWRGADPETDYATIFMSGFSNGYRVIKGPDDKPLIERRTLMQEFTRAGDEFDQREIEFKLNGNPTWLYRADAPLPPTQPAAAAPSEPSAKP